MADDDVADYFDSDALDWFYVEDDFPLADELAESQIPDPGYAGTKFELDMGEHYSDFDIFEYWDDLTYGDDSYWDSAGTSTNNAKRKRTEDSLHRSVAKRRKLSLKDTSGGGVLFMDAALKNTLSRREHYASESDRPYALLPDWRKRFASDDVLVAPKEMPADMEKAAAGDDHLTPEKLSASRLAFTFADEDGKETDDEDAEEEGIDLGSLDPEMLRSVLRQRLGDAGLEGMDENAFMQALNKMLSGGEGDGEIADTLADILLNQATEGDDTAVSGWLSQHGISLEEQDDYRSAETLTAALADPTISVSTGEAVQSSPSDSVLDASACAKGNGTNTRHDLHPSPRNQQLARKRAASPHEEQSPAQKAKQDISQSAQKASKFQPSKSEVDNTADHKLNVRTNGNEDADESLSGEAKIANPAAGKVNSKDGGENDSAEPDETATTTKSAPARPKRKRKADDSSPGGERKQAKRTATSGPAQAAGRRSTRSTRSTTKTSSS